MLEMSKVTKFEDIDAWKVARDLTAAVYRVSRQNSFVRDFGLRDQIQRASVSIMANIAEGFERGGDREFRQFLAQAKGSAGEVRSNLYVAHDVGHLTEDEFHSLMESVLRVSRLLAAFIQYLGTSDIGGWKHRRS
ncbi:MAG: four helix bundle protein [Planctomycetota bacterium]